MRLDHLLSKESTARVFGEFIPDLGKLLRRAPATRPADIPTPRHLRVGVAPPGPAGTGPSLFRFEGARDRCAPRAARHRFPVTVARDLCPPFGGGARSHPLVENCRASTSIKNEEQLPSYKEPTVDALAPDADEGRGWLRKATGSCRPSFDPWISEWGNPAGVMPSHPGPNT